MMMMLVSLMRDDDYGGYRFEIAAADRERAVTS